MGFIFCCYGSCWIIIVTMIWFPWVCCSAVYIYIIGHYLVEVTNLDFIDLELILICLSRMVFTFKRPLFPACNKTLFAFFWWSPSSKHAKWIATKPAPFPVTWRWVAAGSCMVSQRNLPTMAFGIGDFFLTKNRPQDFQVLPEKMTPPQKN